MYADGTPAKTFVGSQVPFHSTIRRLRFVYDDNSTIVIAATFESYERSGLGVEVPQGRQSYDFLQHTEGEKSRRAAFWQGELDAAGGDADLYRHARLVWFEVQFELYALAYQAELDRIGDEMPGR